MRHTLRATLAGAAGLALIVGAAPQAGADLAQKAVVSANPVNFTPHVLDGTVRAIAVVGKKVVVGGNFEKIRSSSSKKQISRHNIFAYDLTTGKIDTKFAPKLNGTVYALQPGDGSTVYVAGSFSTVGGTSTGSLARLSVPSGARVTAFKPNVKGAISTMVRRGARVYIGGMITKVAGQARTALARVNATSGAADSTLNLVPGDSRAGVIKVNQLIVDPKDTRLVINGTFTTVNGHRRYQIAMINTAVKPAALTSWSTERFSPACSPSFYTYMRGMDFAPDGSYFVVTTTGGRFGTATLCDSASRWETARSGANQNPTWVNWTGGDTLLATSVTGSVVYVGGHQRWLDNPYGANSPGPGSVSRPGLGALNPKTGKALKWNPTRTLGHGVEALVANSKGLLVGSDTDQLGHEYHGRLGMFPIR